MMITRHAQVQCSPPGRFKADRPLRPRREAVLAGRLGGVDFGHVLELVNKLLAVAIPGAKLPEDTTSDTLAERLGLLTAGIRRDGGNSARSDSGASLWSRMTGQKQYRGGRSQAGPTRADFVRQFMAAGYTNQQAAEMAARI